MVLKNHAPARAQGILKASKHEIRGDHKVLILCFCSGLFNKTFQRKNYQLTI